jgi:hypothetical protein
VQAPGQKAPRRHEQQEAGGKKKGRGHFGIVVMRIVQVEKRTSQIVKEPAMDRIFDQAEEKQPK